MIFEAHRSLLSAARIPTQCLCGLSPLQKGPGPKTWENALDTVMTIDTKWVVSLKPKEATVLGEGWQGATVRLQWEPGQESKSGRWWGAVRQESERHQRDLKAVLGIHPMPKRSDCETGKRGWQVMRGERWWAFSSWVLFSGSYNVLTSASLADLGQTALRAIPRESRELRVSLSDAGQPIQSSDSSQLCCQAVTLLGSKIPLALVPPGRGIPDNQGEPLCPWGQPRVFKLASPKSLTLPGLAFPREATRKAGALLSPCSFCLPTDPGASPSFPALCVMPPPLGIYESAFGCAGSLIPCMGFL